MNARQANKYLKKQIAKLKSENASMYRTITIDRVIDSLAQNMGHWIECDVLKEVKCSNCRMCFRNRTDYCPNCGAKMESEG